ncbi:fructose-1,6-bisphosphatase [Rubidibacter lacunae KORDI 51-2]|uniref:Fructose-1,6-bisphosphatase n=1 Tax=Rubidibacter lacunae KORDI 51-2 TaxID=582515 RepID=U5DKF3_9CHRO|nr:fructose-1,6-bisphosphatase [Rubidibacter lacunae KORDI 51-2]
MFLDELTPLLKEFSQQPLAFAGGFFSGLLHLSPNEDPLKTWLKSQGVGPESDRSRSSSNAPQSIDIE